MPEFKVLHYQIPVPLGDCSAHLLLRDGKVVKAFLMDGGVSADGVEPHEVISECLQRIWNENDPKDWKFDSWVVTHWDLDHYAGVLDFFEKEKPISRQFFDMKKFRIICGAEPPKSVKSKLAVLKPLLDKLRPEHTGKELIGKDLFTLEQHFLWKDKIAFDKDSPLHDAQPVFCVIGAGGYGIAQTEPFDKKPSPNETSILAILHWPMSKRASYFTGGDGNPKVEHACIDKLWKQKVMVGDIAVAKLDHHGSARENLANAGPSTQLDKTVVEKLNPRRVIVTPGNQYGHPSWDVVDFLGRHAKERKLPKADFLYTTRSPYWMSKIALGQKDINLTKGFKNLAIRSGPHKASDDESIDDSDDDSVEDSGDEWVPEHEWRRKGQSDPQPPPMTTRGRKKKVSTKKSKGSKDPKGKDARPKWQEEYRRLDTSKRKTEKQNKLFYKRYIPDDLSAPYVQLDEAADSDGYEDGEYEPDVEDKMYDQEERQEGVAWEMRNLWATVCPQPLPKFFKQTLYFFPRFTSVADPDHDGEFHNHLVIFHESVKGPVHTSADMPRIEEPLAVKLHGSLRARKRRQLGDAKSNEFVCLVALNKHVTHGFYRVVNSKQPRK